MVNRGDAAASRTRILSRRDMLQVGLVGTVGLTLPRLLEARTPVSAATGTSRSARSCIFIMLSGGPSQIDTLDPKPEAPIDIRGQYTPISTAVPGTYVCEMLPKLAKLADRYTLIRSMSHTVSTHVGAAHVTNSGKSDGNFRNGEPYFGSVMAKLRPSEESVPSYVWLHDMLVGTRKWGQHAGGGILGPAYAPMLIGKDFDTPADPDFRVAALDTAPGVSRDKLIERRELLRRLEGDPRGWTLTREIQSLDTFQQKAIDLVTSPSAKSAFDVTEEPAEVRDRYGMHPLGQYLLMSRRLIEAGVRLVGVCGCTGAPPGFPDPPLRQVWDTHDAYFNEFKEGGGHMYGTGLFGLGLSLPRLDQAVSALFEDLESRGLLDETLVVMVGDFGRTPKFEGKGRGRGHWPNVYTSLLAGGPIRKGFVYGASDRHGAEVGAGQPVSPENFGATIYQALGVSPHAALDPATPQIRVSPGEPVWDVFA
ncbi:MAG: DUF1501 domain-containing protein [Planctomycetaceae bacterium]